MNSAATHADVWVLEQELVLLFRQQDQHWIEEMRLPYSEFIGSAIALSSFSLADTAVYLNVFQNTNTAAFWAEQRWAGVAEHPLRIIDAPVTAFHQQALTELRGMGKNAESFLRQNRRSSITLFKWHGSTSTNLNTSKNSLLQTSPLPANCKAACACILDCGHSHLEITRPFEG